MSILAERELTDEERAAIADEPRPGVWIEEDRIFATINNQNIISQRTGRAIPPIRPSFDVRGDGRVLTQDEADQLIATELYFTTAAPGFDPSNAELLDIVGEPMDVVIMDVPVRSARQQRGGIHSDPLVRLLAFRAWGERDRRWFDIECSDTEALQLLPGALTPAPTHTGHRVRDVSKTFDQESMRVDLTCSCGTKLIATTWIAPEPPWNQPDAFED